MQTLTPSQTALLVAARELPHPASDFVYGWLIQAAVKGEAITPERLATLLDEATATTA